MVKWENFENQKVRGVRKIWQVVTDTRKLGYHDDGMSKFSKITLKPVKKVHAKSPISFSLVVINVNTRTSVKIYLTFDCNLIQQ